MAKDLTGYRIHKLTVIKPTSKRTKSRTVIWECRCDCGNTTYLSSRHIMDGRHYSCGCYQKELAKAQGIALREKLKETHIDGTNVKLLKSKVSANNTSGIKGVCYKKSENKWVARITFKGKNYHLGYYDKIEDAARARKIAEEKLFGEFLKWYENEYKKSK